LYVTRGFGIDSGTDRKMLGDYTGEITPSAADARRRESTSRVESA
jgi:hypothetical protein